MHLHAALLITPAALVRAQARMQVAAAAGDEQSYSRAKTVLQVVESAQGRTAHEVEQGEVGATPEEVVSALQELLAAPSWDETQRVLVRQREVLLTDTAIDVLETTAENLHAQGQDGTAAHLERNLGLLKQARMLGIDATFAAYQEASSRDSSAEHTDSVEVAQALGLLSNATTWNEFRDLLHQYDRVLLSDYASTLLRKAISEMPSAEEDSDIDRLKLYLRLFERARVDGIDAAVTALSDELGGDAAMGGSKVSGEVQALLDQIETLTRPEDLSMRQALIEKALALVSRAEAPDVWADLQWKHGLALFHLAETMGAKERAAALRKAIASYDAALLEYRREVRVDDWAVTQVNKGGALILLARGLSLSEQSPVLREALACLDDVLRERSREAAPRTWAIAHMNRGDALSGLSEILSNEERAAALREAIASYDAALLEYRREEDPKNWANIQNLKGYMLDHLAQTEGGEERAAALREAIACFDAALLEYRREEDPKNWANLRARKGRALDHLAQTEGGEERAAALREAIACFDAALLEYRREEDPKNWALVRYEKGITLRNLAETLRGEERAATLREAIASYDAALLEYRREEDPKNWAGAQNNRGMALSDLGQRLGGEERAATLHEAIACFDAALLEFRREEDADAWATIQNNKGTALVNLSHTLDEAARTSTLRQAISAYDTALQTYRRTVAPMEWASTQVNKGTALVDLALTMAGEQKADELRQAMNCFDVALGMLQPGAAPLIWASNQARIGNALLHLSEAVDHRMSVAVLHQSVARLDAALTELRRDVVPIEWAYTEMNKGTVLDRLAGNLDGEERVAALREAIACYDAALLELSREVIPADWAASQANKGSALRRLAGNLDGEERVAALREAIACYDAALLELSREEVPASWAGAQYNRARALSDLAKELTGEVRETALREAVAGYEAALTEYPRQVSPSMHRLLAQGVGELLFSEGRWAEAAKYLDAALNALDDLYSLSVTTPGRQGELSKGGDLAVQLGYALVRAGGEQAALKAAEALERSRARATGEALARERAQIEDAIRVAPELLGEFRSANQRLAEATLEREDSPPLIATGSNALGDAESVGLYVLNRQLVGYEEAKAARDIYNEVLTRIRTKFPTFLESTSPLPNAVAALAPGEALVYIASSPAGAISVILSYSERKEGALAATAYLDTKLTQGLINQLVGSLEERSQEQPAPVGFLPAQFGQGKLGKALSQTMLALGTDDSVITTLAAACRTWGLRRLVIIPCGLLGLLPLHAALVPTPDGGDIRVPLQDIGRVSYAPSARVWLASRQRALSIPNTTAPDVLVVGNPLPQIGAASLPGAEEEARLVVRLVTKQARGRVHHLETTAATSLAVLSTLRDFGASLTCAHFACHGEADPNEPEHSSLLLADGARLMVRDLLDPQNAINFAHLRLAVLSACQTGIPGMKLPDEVVGLPAGWLQAGAAGVLASLWPVSDDATVALMGRFYELYLIDGLDPVDALWLAQRWLRGLPSWREEYVAAGARQAAKGPAASDVVHELARARGGRAAVRALEANENDEVDSMVPTTSRDKRVHKWQRPSVWAAFALYGA
jgi:hypothetical protein